MSAPAPSRLLVSREAYTHNLQLVRDALPKDCELAAVVKANAYGLGAPAVARWAVEAGADMLAVAHVSEGVALRKQGIESAILVLVEAPAAAYADAIEYGLELTLSDVGSAARLAEVARARNRIVPIHCKVDTGMGRQGFPPDAFLDRMRSITRMSPLDIQGVCTHLPSTEQPNDDETRQEIRRFKHLLGRLNTAGVPYETAHAANSGAVVNYRESHFDMVRVGIVTYGVWPSGGEQVWPVKPVVRWETNVALVREVAAGQSIGYGRTYTCSEPVRVAMLPVGYADGYPRTLSNRAEVLIRGVRCPVRGRVSMDQIVVDVTRVPQAAVNDTAVLIGEDGGDRVTVTDLAEQAGTISYEILTGIGPRVERVYT